MFSGVGLFGTLSGFLAAWFLGHPEKDAPDLVTELRALRADVERLHQKLDERASPARPPE